MCQCAGWTSGNIGTKYLQLMRYVIRVNSAEFKIQKDQLVTYEILSVAIRRILYKLRHKILDYNDNQILSKEERILLCQMSLTCREIISNCTIFDWFKNVGSLSNKQLHQIEKILKDKYKKSKMSEKTIKKHVKEGMVNLICDTCQICGMLMVQGVHKCVPQSNKNE